MLVYFTEIASFKRSTLYAALSIKKTTVSVLSYENTIEVMSNTKEVSKEALTAILLRNKFALLIRLYHSKLV